MNPERLQYLIANCGEPDFSATEEAELLAYFADGDTEEAEEVFQQGLLQQQAAQVDEQQWEPVLAKILAPAVVTPVRRIGSVRTTFVRYAAAAAVIACIVLGWWIVDRKDNEKEKITAANIQTTTIVPGANKAILVDASGKEIVLDASATMQVGNAIIKNGVAIYASQNEVAYNTLRTPKGGLFQVVLPDGTHVWINSASSLKYPTAFHSETRVVELEGEGYFEVAEDASHPFIVRTRTDSVQVLGTHFNINAYQNEGEVRTTLTKGKVRVGSAILQPGQQYAGGNITKPDIDEVMAWKEGKFRFKRAPVEAIMRQIERWYDADIRYDGNVEGLVLSGSVPRTQQIETLLQALEETGTVRLKLEGRTIHVTPK